MTAESDIIDVLYRVLVERKRADPKTSYVAGLYEQGIDEIIKKIGEEAVELAIAGKNASPAEIVHEAADLWFHSLVLLAYSGVDPSAVMSELKRRLGQSGLEEKASRQQQ